MSVCVDEERKEEWFDERLLETEKRNIEPTSIVLESLVAEDDMQPEEPSLQ